MAEVVNAIYRQLIPRWHTSRKLELMLPKGTALTMKPSADVTDDYRIAHKKLLWKEGRTASSAIELFSSLILSEQKDDVEFEETRRFLSENFRDKSKAVSQIVSPDLKKIDVSNSYTINKDRVIGFIAALKKILKYFPRDALSWHDLSFYYMVLGEREKSERSMYIAHSMHRSHPFLARSYARLLIHNDDPEKAVSILRRTGEVKNRPELLSADIAIRSKFNIGNIDISAARKLLSIYKDHPSMISELSAGLGTLEVENGALKKSKKILSLCVESPTENTIAQLEWLRQQHDIVIPEYDYDIRSIEADAIHSFHEGEYKKCRDTLMMLHRFQPFSDLPLVDAGYISMFVLDNPGYLISNKEYFSGDVVKSFMGVNNYIVSKMQLGDTSNIDIELMGLQKLIRDDRERAVFSATVGMYLYLAGFIDEGRKKYNDASEYFRKTRNDFSLSVSLTYQGMVEKSLGLNTARDILERAVKEAKKVSESPELLEKANRELETLVNKGDKPGQNTFSSNISQ
jgi:tetratricopeptide (TPR) repeat protein